MPGHLSPLIFSRSVISQSFFPWEPIQSCMPMDVEVLAELGHKNGAFIFQGRLDSITKSRIGSSISSRLEYDRRDMQPTFKHSAGPESSYVTKATYADSSRSQPSEGDASIFSAAKLSTRLGFASAAHMPLDLTTVHNHLLVPPGCGCTNWGVHHGTEIKRTSYCSRRENNQGRRILHMSSTYSPLGLMLSLWVGPVQPWPRFTIFYKGLLMLPVCSPLESPPQTGGLRSRPSQLQAPPRCRRMKTPHYRMLLLSAG